MSETFISHVGDVVKYLKEYWHLIAGATATLYGAALMVKRNWLAGYATKQEMNDCHANLSKKIEENRELNTTEHNELRDIIIRHLDK